MNETFQAHIEALEPAFERLVKMSPVTVATLPRKMPEAGIYLFSESDVHLYVGRSNRMRTRLQSHCRPSSGHYSAGFAFHLAREITRHTAATYTSHESRAELEREPQFATAFIESKERIRQMAVRFVGESDPMRQALLEMYTAVALGTQYNDFDTH